MKLESIYLTVRLLMQNDLNNQSFIVNVFTKNKDL